MEDGFARATAVSRVEDGGAGGRVRGDEAGDGAEGVGWWVRVGGRGGHDA